MNSKTGQSFFVETGPCNYLSRHENNHNHIYFFKILSFLFFLGYGYFWGSLPPNRNRTESLWFFNSCSISSCAKIRRNGGENPGSQAIHQISQWNCTQNQHRHQRKFFQHSGEFHTIPNIMCIGGLRMYFVLFFWIFNHGILHKRCRKISHSHTLIWFFMKLVKNVKNDIIWQTFLNFKICFLKKGRFQAYFMGEKKLNN